MNAPTIWIIAPAGIAILLLFITNQRALSLIGGSLAVILALAAQFLPIEKALQLGTFAIKVRFFLDDLGPRASHNASGRFIACFDLCCYSALVLWCRSSQIIITAGSTWVDHHIAYDRLHRRGTFSVRGALH